VQCSLAQLSSQTGWRLINQPTESHQGNQLKMNLNPSLKVHPYAFPFVGFICGVMTKAEYATFYTSFQELMTK